MGIIDRIKYTLWPAINVRLTFWWWVVKYGGKKNIPRELIFGKMTDSMEKMRKNLMEALRHIPADMNDDEKKELLDLIRLSGELKSDAEKMKK